MRNKIIGIFVCTLLIATALPAIGTHSEVANRNNIFSFNNVLNGGWLEEIDGVKVLHLNGSYYEMGYQYGYLLKDEIEENYRGVLNLTDADGYNNWLEKWNSIFKYYIPQDYIDEMQGLADGSGISINDVHVVNFGWAFIIGEVGCSDFAAWGPATVDGKLYQMHSEDDVNTIDPETGISARDNQVLIVSKPDNRYASLYTALAGFVTGLDGINEKGISISQSVSSTDDYTYHGIDCMIQIRMVLDRASSVTEGIEILRQNRTGGNYFIVSDGKIPTAFICEQTANLMYVGSWDNNVEENNPFWQINHVLRRKNFFIHPLLASTQRPNYNPKQSVSPVAKLFGTNEYYDWWRFYRTISKEAEKLWGNLNINNTMAMIRSVYKGETDLLMRFWNSGEFTPPYHQWVSCPETGDIAISFGTAEKSAYHNPIHYFNFYDLLNSEPP